MELEKFNTFLGMNIGSTPSNVLKAEWASDTKNWILIISVLAVPVLAAATQWINTKLMPQMQSNTGSKGKKAKEDGKYSFHGSNQLILNIKDKLRL